MKRKTFLTSLLLVLICSQLAFSQTKVYIVGTTHRPINLINADTLENILGRIKPDVILVELDSTILTVENDFNYDLKKYPDLLENTSMENIAMCRYQQKHNIKLRPFDFTGRNDFYQRTDYFAKEDSLFSEMLAMQKNKEYSTTNQRLFDVTWNIIKFYAEAEDVSFEDINSDVRQKFTELKYTTYDMFLQICQDEPKLHKWIDFAQLQRDFWIERNQKMVDNILLFAKEFNGKTLAIVVGYEHKYFIVNKLKDNANIELRDIFRKTEKN